MEKAINTWAVSILRHTTGITDLKVADLEATDSTLEGILIILCSSPALPGESK